jgi:putative transposase
LSRPLRIEYPDAWYHVMNRGRAHEKVFADDRDYLCFIDLLRDSTDLWKVRVAAFCLMPNHYHILLQTPLANLSRCMRHVNGVYTQRYNRRHGSEGQVFRGRYKSILVEADAYLLHLVRYIHRNPLKAGLVERISGYRWSSHKAYVSRADKWKWLCSNYILAQFGDTRMKALSSYTAFVREEDPAEITDFYSHEKVASVLGSESFVEWVKVRFSDEKSHAEIPESQQLLPSFDKIMTLVCKAYGTDASALVKGRRGRANEARSITMYLARKLRCDDLMTIARRFGLGRHSSVSTDIERLRRKASKDEGLRCRLAQLEALAKGASSADLTPLVER